MTALTPRTTEQVCLTILELLLPHRRATGASTEPAAAYGPQLEQLADMVETGEPILFTLPGFPCKSPNPAKVLGHLPDEGERRSLRFLDDLCARVAEVYPPGARILICSDGHVFADLIQVPDDHVDEYSAELRVLIAEEGLDRLDTFDLRDVYGDMSYVDKREMVTKEHGPTIEELRSAVRADDATLSLYRGITRFLVEDTAKFDGSRSALQRECRRRAYGVIQRSRAWGELIAVHHPRQVRLSIHPQPVGAPKFGIQLLSAGDSWTTPWHAAPLVSHDGSIRLTRRTEAERVGHLVHRNGRPSHFLRD
jgi:pyoverdine/dityrosine biosynthesis protein Dit1